MNRKLWMIAAICALACPAILANAPSYSFVQGNWESVDPDVGDSGTGPMLNMSYGVTDLIHVVGSYEDIGFDITNTISADMTVWQVGGGVHHTMPQAFDLFGEASIVDAEVDVDGLGSESDTGFSVSGGARKQFGQGWEVNGTLQLIDAGPLDDTLIGVGALYTMKERYSITAGYKVGDFDTLNVGFRWTFGAK